MKELTTTYSHEKSYYFLSLSLEKTVLTSLKRLLFEKKKWINRLQNDQKNIIVSVNL